MAIKTLKISTAVTILESGNNTIIEDIMSGKYKVAGSRNLYTASEIAAQKTKPAKKARTPINKRGERLKVLDIIYKILIADLKPLHPVCEGKLPGCTHKATQIHHKKGRRGLLLILSKYFGYLCDNCHKFCTPHSKEAKDLGLSLPINSITEYDFTDREKELIKKYKVRIPGNINVS